MVRPPKSRSSVRTCWTPRIHVSAPEPSRMTGLPATRWRPSAPDAIELAAFRGRERDLAARLAARGLTVPLPSRCSRQAAGAVLSVRPARWLLLLERREPGASHAEWAAACAGAAAVVDLSAALVAFHACLGSDWRGS